MEWKIGPGTNSKRRLVWSYTCTPVTSEGSRSGGNWIRAWEPLTVLASALASEVFPVPGKSSSSRWPSDSRQVKASRTTWSLPRMALLMLATMRSKASLNRAACSGLTVTPVLPYSRPCVGTGDSAAGGGHPFAWVAVPVQRVLALVGAPGAGDEPVGTVLAVEGAGDVAAETGRLHVDVGAMAAHAGTTGARA